MRWLHRFIVGLALAASAAGAQSPFASPSYAIVGARIEIGDGRVVEKGTVLIRNGLIAAVGSNVTVPPEAEVIKGDGLIVYPGFIDAHMTEGLKLPDAQPTQDTPPDTVASAPPFMREANRKGVRPELRAVDHLAFTDATLFSLRQQGFTTALLLPAGGTINGVGALVNLSGQPRRDCVVRSAVAMDFAFGGGFSFGVGGGYPGSLMGYIAHLRQTLLDACTFHTLQAAFARGGSQRPPDDDALQALQPVLDGTLPVVFEAGSEKEIVRALKIAEEFNLRLIVSGGEEAWKAAPLLTQRKTPVLVSLDFGVEPGAARGRGSGMPPRRRPPSGDTNRPPASAPNRPPVGDPSQTPPPASPTQTPLPAGDRPVSEADDLPKAVLADQQHRREERIANAAKLNQAGVLFAFTTRGTRSLSEFISNLRLAVKSGLPKGAALRALTIHPAMILNVDKQLGTVEAGKVAALVVMTGDFTDAAAKVKYLFIDKSKFEPDRDPAPTPTSAPLRFPVEEDDP